MIAYVRLESLEGKPHSDECRYDRYPGKVERIQLPSGLLYARKKGKKWIESEDWGESGKPLKKEQLAQLNDLGRLGRYPVAERNARDARQEPGRHCAQAG